MIFLIKGISNIYDIYNKLVFMDICVIDKEGRISKMGLAIGNEYNSLNHSTSISTNSSITSQVSSSENSVKTSSSHLNTGTIKFVMENGIAEYAYVDGIKMDLADMFLTSNSQLKERIIEKYNKTDAEKLEEIFGL